MKGTVLLSAAYKTARSHKRSCRFTIPHNNGGLYIMDENDNSDDLRLIPPHGGYENLLAFQMAEIVFDGTIRFCERFISRRSRTWDQMEQAARSGKQNIAEGSQVSGTSKKMELKLVGVARASLEELLRDYNDFVRTKKLFLWDKDHRNAKKIRALCYTPNRSYETYRVCIEECSAEIATNTMICLINQANYLLDQLLRALEKDILKNGGFTERLYRIRSAIRNMKKKK